MNIISISTVILSIVNITIATVIVLIAAWIMFYAINFVAWIVYCTIDFYLDFVNTRKNK